MARPTPIPIRVETHADIPRKLVRLYEADGTGFVLTNPGKVLSLSRRDR